MFGRLYKTAVFGLCLCLLSYVVADDEEKKEREKTRSPKTLADHFDDDHHESSFDHGAILGSLKEIAAFGKMSKNESHEKLGEYFDKIDTNKDGYITAQELEVWIAKSLRNLDQDMAKVRFSDLDKDKDGKLIWSEYLHEQFGVTPEEYANMTEVDKQDHDHDLNEVPYEQKKFDLCDKDKDGSLDPEEYAIFAYPQDYPEIARIEVEKHFNNIDANKDGQIEPKEYFGDDSSDESNIREDRKILFTSYDKNNDGKIDLNEYRAIIMPGYEATAKSEAAHLIDIADTSKDKKLTIAEFENLFKLDDHDHEDQDENNDLADQDEHKDFADQDDDHDEL